MPELVRYLVRIHTESKGADQVEVLAQNPEDAIRKAIDLMWLGLPDPGWWISAKPCNTQADLIGSGAPGRFE